MTPPTLSRRCSLDPVDLERWRWAPFLDHAVAALQPLRPVAYPIEAQFLRRDGVTGSKAQPIAVSTATWACSTEKLRQVRAACVEAGASASVLNFVINPSCRFDLPFFGADLVTLPSGHLIALDLQPALKTDDRHTSAVWKRLLPIWEQWQQQLPEGGPIPSEAQPYFSPGFLWTRLPLGEEGDELIRSAVFPAFVAYLNLYLQLVAEASPVEENRRQELLAGQHRYLAYRAEKDPARGMLTRFHGAEWTEAYIHGVLFDL
jgi:phycoerythrobilin:ferredoxin oxidoreductase